jgi:acetyl-CoA synthetase
MTVQSSIQARNFLQRHRGDYETADRDFRSPELGELNSGGTGR